MDVVIQNLTQHFITIAARKPGAPAIDARSAHKMSNNVIRVTLLPGRNVVDKDKFELIRKIKYYDHLVADGHIQALGQETPVNVQKKLEEKIEIEKALKEKAEKELKEATEKLKAKKDKKDDKSKDEVKVVE